MTIQVANAPCSWGVLEFDDLDGESADAHTFLGELREAGYAGTELGDWGFMPTDPVALAELLDAFDLPLLGGFVPVALTEPESHEAGVDMAIRTAKLMAAVNPDAFIVLADDNGSDPMRTKNAGRIDPATHGLAPILWRYVIHGAEELARQVRDATGLRTVFHHHAAGWVETPDEVAKLLQRTDPELLGLCFDTGHWTFGGGDALDGLRKHGDRIWHVHFKDCEPTVHATSREQQWDYFESVKHGVFCELGRGQVDFASVLDELRTTDYDGWIVVEQDVLPGMGSPLQSATRNRQFLKTLGI